MDPQLIEPIPPTPPKSKLPIILASLVVLLLVGGGGIFLGRQLSKTPDSTPAPIVTVPTAMPTADPTTYWQTFADQQKGFSFRYPPGYSVRQGEGVDVFDYINPIETPEPNQESSSHYYYLRVASDFSPSDPIYTKSNQGQFTVYSTDQLPSQSGDITKVFSTVGSKYASISLTPYNRHLLDGTQGTTKEQSVLKSRLETLDLIISTFKFTNPAQSTTPPVSSTDWKTYPSSFGFSLQYPQDWDIQTNKYDGQMFLSLEDTWIFPPKADPNEGFHVHVWPMKAELTLEWYRENVFKEYQLPTGTPLDIKETDFLGNKALVDRNGSLYVKKGEYLYTFGWSYSSTSEFDSKHIQSIYNQILSTFKFTN